MALLTVGKLKMQLVAPIFSAFREEVQHGLLYLDLLQASMSMRMKNLWAVGDVTKLWVWVFEVIQV